jgi:UDP-N-acetylglucosamine--N-acetylmuramyl-(pentapeptide) pyrophosphoryl-undecaprenol N-acetylglucosamine transferase
VTNNHQEKNARVLEKGGGALVLLEEECTAARVYQEINSLLKDQARAAEMSGNLRKMAVSDSANRICRIAEELAAKKQK